MYAKKNTAHLGFESRTSHTQCENHIPRASSPFTVLSSYAPSPNNLKNIIDIYWHLHLMYLFQILHFNILFYHSFLLLFLLAVPATPVLTGGQGGRGDGRAEERAEKRPGVGG